jgi:hypothetical protein
MNPPDIDISKIGSLEEALKVISELRELVSTLREKNERLE